MKKYLFITLGLLFIAGCSDVEHIDAEIKPNITVESTTVTTEKEYYFEVYRPKIQYLKDGKKIKLTGNGRPNSNVEVYSSVNANKLITSSKTDGLGNFEIVMDTPLSSQDYTFKNEKKTLTLLIDTRENFEKTDEQLAQEKKDEEEKLLADQKQKEDERLQKAAEEVANIKAENEKKAAQKSADEALGLKIANATREQKNALEKAKQYIAYTSFSKTGLYDQLVFEGFPNDAAQFGADCVNVNWNEQALKKANEYMKHSAMSDQALSEQLSFEGFTQTEVQYAMDSLPK